MTGLESVQQAVYNIPNFLQLFPEVLNFVWLQWNWLLVHEYC